MMLFEVLLRRGFSETEAQGIISEMQDRVWDGENPEEVLAEFELEPDYVFDILDWGTLTCKMRR